MARKEIAIAYTPRDAFMPFHNRAQRWACLVAHRRAGKTVAAVNDIIRAAVTCKTPSPLFGYIAPYRSQAKSVAWDYLKRFCKPIAKAANEAELQIDLINGARIRLFGADNADAMRGLGFDGIFMDEYGDFRPSVWGHVIRPTLSDKQGWAVFGGTPKGKNQFWDIYQTAKLAPKEWFLLRLTATDSGILPQSELDAVKAQITTDQYMQEYECSFEAAILGAYYGVEMREASDQGRITAVPYDPSIPTYTAWDLGYRDDTAIWWYQVVRNEIHIIDYYAVSGASISDIAKVVLEKPYHYGKHYLPHDARAKTLAAQGKSVIEQLAEFLGLANIGVVPDLGVQDGIQAVRMTLPKCWFDELKCHDGIEALRQYEREFDEDKKAFRTTPKHNWCSHPCLVAGSMIQTDCGLVAIENVKIGDRVFTPAGYSVVTNSGPTKNADKLIEIITPNGTLICTPEHKILTNRGFVIADELRYSDRLFSGKEWQCTLIGLFSKVLPTGFRANITGEMSGEVKAPQIYTEQFGYPSTVQFLMDAISTTLTETRSTTISPTLFASTEANIAENIHWSVLRRGNYSHQIITPYSKLQNGTLLQKVFCGTANMLKKHGKIANGMKEIAINAVSFITRLILRVPSSATPIVSKRPIDCAKESPLVYDLTVQKHGCYQANGLMVSNCDAFRMMAIAWRGEDSKKIVAFDRPLIVGPGNTATLNDMWAATKPKRRARL